MLPLVILSSCQVKQSYRQRALPSNSSTLHTPTFALPTVSVACQAGANSEMKSRHRCSTFAAAACSIHIFWNVVVSETVKGKCACPGSASVPPALFKGRNVVVRVWIGLPLRLHNAEDSRGSATPVAGVPVPLRTPSVSYARRTPVRAGGTPALPGLAQSKASTHYH